MLFASSIDMFRTKDRILKEGTCPYTPREIPAYCKAGNSTIQEQYFKDEHIEITIIIIIILLKTLFQEATHLI